MTKTKALLASAMLATMTLSGGIGTAEAGWKGKHRFHKFHHFHSYGWRRPSYGWGGGYGCGYYKRMWWRTGDWYWKRKYYACRY